jgi:hypothetical protein
MAIQAVWYRLTTRSKGESEKSMIEEWFGALVGDDEEESSHHPTNTKIQS